MSHHIQEDNNDQPPQQMGEMVQQLSQLRVDLNRQLELEAKVHRTLLPNSVRHDSIHVDVRYDPIEEVGGDYCQVRFADKHTCYITMCDVSHGPRDRSGPAVHPREQPSATFYRRGAAA